ncbi:MAG: toprim domain-containing protein, partial [Oscillospiraceae bacterium]|nr:toprim domain-containing protein [Oscillospiraceae bacterium]
VLCLDADGPGQEATEKFQEEYAQKGYAVSTRTPAHGKDWNEFLQHQVFGREVTVPTPKQPQSKGGDRINGRLRTTHQR